MLNNKRYNIDRFSNHDKIYFGNVERPYVIEPAGLERNKYDVFSDFLASFIYKHGYNDSMKGISQESKDWVFNKDFEKLMNVYAAVDEVRAKNNLKSLGVNTYVNHLKMNGMEIQISEDIKDKLEAGMFQKIKGKELRTESAVSEEAFSKKQTIKL